MKIKLLILLLLFAGCERDFEKRRVLETNPYSFFVAGHVYGHPVTYSYGMHKPFVNAIYFLNHKSKMKFGILAGDVVPHPTKNYWDSAESNISKFNFPIYIAPGNHDRGKEFENRYSEYYFSFVHNTDLFIFLSPTNWNIEGEQLKFLKNTLKEYDSISRNIFITTHELIYWNPYNEFGNIKLNYLPHFPGSTNYWDEIHPLLDSLKNEVFIFSGDLGCCKLATPYLYHKMDNISFIATGMGNGKEDNLVIVNVDSLGGVEYELIHLNDEMFGNLSLLKSFKLP